MDLYDNYYNSVMWNGFFYSNNRIMIVIDVHVWFLFFVKWILFTLQKLSQLKI